MKKIKKLQLRETFSHSRFSKANLTVFALIFAVIGVYIIYKSFAATPSITYYVANSGSDTNPGTQTQPFQNIAKAVLVATPGDTILVNSGVYHETVSIKVNTITLRGIGPTKPIIDGDNVRSAGVYYGALALVNEVVDNFEIRNLNVSTNGGRSVGILGYRVANSVFKNNDIHDVSSSVAGAYAYGVLLGDNGAPRVAHDDQILNNKIHKIGPTGESMGIWLLYTQSITMDSNTIYMVRKEGIRDWHGTSNIITNNRAFMNWIGIETETAHSTYVANNYVYNNVFGFTTKHPTGLDSGTGSCPTQPDTYDKDANGNVDKTKWTRFWHNTAYHNSAAGMAIGMNAPPGDYIDIENNIFASNGSVNVWNWPWATCGHVVLDGNIYSREPATRPVYDYYTGWNSPPGSLTTTVGNMYNLPYNGGNTTTDTWLWPGWFEAGVTKPLHYEQHGQDYNMTFNNVANGDFNYASAPPNPGNALGDSYGSQIGARNVPAAPVLWTEYPLTAISASVNGPSNNFGNANRTTDDIDSSYWWSSGAADPNHNHWITYDLGQARTIQQFEASVFAHLDSRNSKNYKIEVSNDNVTYTSVLTGANPDSAGSSYKYELAQPVSARYIRYTMIDNFGGAYFVFPEFQVGLITTAGSTTPPPATPPPVTPPPPPATAKVGDVNSDGKVDLFDMSTLLSKYNLTDAACDLNKDGVVNIFDLSSLLSHYGT